MGHPRAPRRVMWVAFVEEWWPLLVAAANLACSLGASAHVVLYKRDARAAVSWVGMIWLVPFFGALLYLALGVNRIRRKALALREQRGRPAAPLPSGLYRIAGEPFAQLQDLALLAGRVTGAPLLPGNRVEPLVTGREAYPAMLEGVDAAQRFVLLSTYIFDNDAAGRQFIEALGRAAARGVAVRVLIDDMGSRYRWPRAAGALRRAGVTTAHFLPGWFPWHIRYSNLRNHRKLLLVDGMVGFTGGMNIRQGNLLLERDRHAVRDVHFRLAGPILRQMQAVFADDWRFTTGEALDGPDWQVEPPAAGPVFARGIAGGPDEEFEQLRTTLLGALACARRSVFIATPYFLPDAALVQALNVAGLRGVAVEILLPARCNLRLVGWAQTAQLWQVVDQGCRVWLVPPPFDHTKLMVVDEAWSLIGSANWDPRSLRLNFEYDVECYDPALAGRLSAMLRERIAGTEPLTTAELERRSLPVRLRDGLARLFTPFL